MHCKSILVLLSCFFLSVFCYHSLSDFCHNFSLNQTCQGAKNYTREAAEFQLEEKNYTSVVIQPRRRVNVNSDSTLTTSGISWYSKIPLLPVFFASSPTIPEGNCKRHALRYLEELRNGTLWAVQMFDASTKYPDGIITGNTRHFGNFDGCYDLKTSIPRYKFDIETEDEEINGRYCLVKVEYHKMSNFSDRKDPHTLEFDTNDSVWEAIKEKGDFRRVKRYILELALCVPDSCGTVDIKQALAEPLKEIGLENDIFIDITMKGNCQAQNDKAKLSTVAKIYCYTILSLVLLVIASTWYESTMKSDNEKDNFMLLDLFLCFSARRNYKSIAKTTYSHPGLDSIHIFRVMFMIMVIYGHRSMQYYTNPTMNSHALEFSYTLPISIFLYNGPIIVEAFFGFGGLLLAYYVLMELDKKGKIDFIKAIVFRYIRLTPPYAVLIMFIALILPHLGSGPYWSLKVGLESESCSNNWWANLLYINNYVNTDKLCMFQSWYLSTDYHLYILSLFTIYAFWKMPRRLGYAFLVSIIFIGCLIPFSLTYFYGVQPMFRGLPFMQEVREDDYFINHYIKTHERLTSYFIGVLGGAIVYDHKKSLWKLPKVTSHILYLCCWIIAVSSLYLGLKYYNPNAHPSKLETALYASLSRPGFAFGMVLGTIVLSVGEGLERLQGFHQPSWAQPISKLTYGAFLVHNINQVYDIGVRRIAQVFSIHNMVSDLIPDIVLSFFFSFVIALVIEGPFRNIEKRLLRKEKIPKDQEKCN
ncbi:GSCOCG00013530001-RA-CDS [Cotesia congregata]|uniref:Similar to nrf-6: Nose resistant to fluoxetine protein 6 (Caenorhabditis elegans) n=1 Tax=Cotesia congregata TaxID=51543 RepID=A0A8J2E7J4_COTCN|nr:GSCOCG00013530001-RA-CDS [Cotesia congregata]CAG5076021.1 Similar to nrf-6: Nose resistant to fluoxetine protein 6 (Caenorhabditis elegans) [Cotesia congregata]